jgi:hypothetical protein
MLLVEFEATPFAACYRHAVAQRNWATAIVQWCKITERFEFEGFLLLTVRPERDDHLCRFDIASEVCRRGSPLVYSIDDEKGGAVRRVKPQRPPSRD